MKLYFLAIICSILFLKYASGNSSLDDLWKAWKLKYEKVYSPAEESKRQEIWEMNFNHVLKHNSRYENGTEHYELEVNAFSDKESHELFFRSSRFNQDNSFCLVQHKIINSSLPTHVDWRKKGFVTPVCNKSIYATSSMISAVGSLEGQHFNKTKKLIPLSIQDLVDCCGNRTPPDLLSVEVLYKCIYDMNGIDTAESYPPKKPGECQFNLETIGATVTGCFHLASGSEAALEHAVATVGPIAVRVDAAHPSFQHYKKGVYYEPECSDWRVVLGMLVVGYGEENGQKYWIVKNSWGTSWGMDGYIHMAKDRGNNCGIASQAVYPTV